MARADKTDLKTHSHKRLHLNGGSQHQEDVREFVIENYGDLFDLVPCIITIQNREYRILKHNKEFAGRFGFHEGDYCYKAYKGRSEKCRDCPLEKTFNDGKVHYSEESGINKDGKITYWVVRTAPLMNEDGKIEAVMEFCTDVTERIEAEHQLVQASKLAILGRMASGIAHELNQPLSVIKTASGFLLKKTSRNEGLDHQLLLNMLSKIDANVDRASRTITGMREFSRKSDMALEGVNVNRVLMHAIDMFAQQIKVRGITLDNDFQKNLPDISADPNRLEQVFMNLLLNAQDAIGEKFGEDKYHQKDKKVIRCRTFTDKKKVGVEISDNGIGIPENIRQQIFEPFFTTKKAGAGTGLGLSISHGIIHDFGGTIELNKRDDEWTSFRILFPLMKSDRKK
jgi:histidine kinase